MTGWLNTKAGNSAEQKTRRYSFKGPFEHYSDSLVAKVGLNP